MFNQFERSSEFPFSRKWEKKIVAVGHLRLYKWIPVADRGRLENEEKSRKQEFTPYNEETDRLINDNVPITRSITAAFTKEQKFVTKQEKKQLENLVLRIPSKLYTSNNQETQPISNETHKLNSKSHSSNIETEDSKLSETLSEHDQSAYNSETFTPEAQSNDEEEKSNSQNEEESENEFRENEREDDQVQSSEAE